MAGAGFKSFAAGEVLLASEVNTFLMEQTVMVFDSAAARDGVITAPSEGMLCYLKDTNAVEKYTGSDWVAVVEDASPITTEGDLIVGDASGDPVRLPVGAAGEVLTSDGDTVSFVTPAAAGGFATLATGTLSGASVSLTAISGTHKNLQLVLRNFRPATDGTFLQVKFNSSSGNLYTATLNGSDNNAFFTGGISILMTDIDNGASSSLVILDVLDYANATTRKTFRWAAQGNNNTTPTNATTRFGFGVFDSTAAITAIEIKAGSGNMTSGDFILYGVS